MGHRLPGMCKRLVKEMGRCLESDLCIQVLQFSIENEIVSLGTQVDCDIHPQETKREAIAILERVKEHHQLWPMVSTATRRLWH